MANKQTSVQCLIERLLECDTKNYNSMLQIEISQEYLNDLVNAAKQMEKEQIEDAFEYGWSARNADSMKYGKQYYQETYKNKEK